MDPESPDNNKALSAHAGEVSLSAQSPHCEVVPAELGSEFSIAVKIGKTERMTPLVKVQPVNANAAAVVDKTLMQVVQASDKQGLDTKTIAAITGATVEPLKQGTRWRTLENPLTGESH
eukprot:2528531-Amphidinium_carterae.1